MFKGVAGWEPPIVCAKLVIGCLVCAFGRPGTPLLGAPNPQLVLLSKIQSVLRT